MTERARFAALAASDSAAFVRGWRAITGGKAIVVSADFPAPEIVHSFGMLPVTAGSADAARSFRGFADGWILPERFRDPCIPGGKPIFRLPEPWPTDVLSALDLLEAIAEWAGAVSGTPYSEGSLRKSMAIYRERDGLVRRLSAAEGEGGDPLVVLAKR